MVFLIDRSGSMGNSVDDTIGGFNSFIQKEIKKELDIKVTTVLFDDKYEMLYKRKPIQEVEQLTAMNVLKMEIYIKNIHFEEKK